MDISMSLFGVKTTREFATKKKRKPNVTRNLLKNISRKAKIKNIFHFVKLFI